MSLPDVLSDVLSSLLCSSFTLINCFSCSRICVFLSVQMVERGTALLNKMEINVTEAEKRTGKNTVNMQETYTVYLIETRWVRQWFSAAI